MIVFGLFEKRSKTEPEKESSGNDLRLLHVPWLQRVREQRLVALRPDEPRVAILLEQQQVDVTGGLLEREPTRWGPGQGTILAVA